ncbi:MAG: LL-diaminopimelate aminotransferase [Rickettsiaceae bacterium]|jgi:alanine-synthesizing transaminase|nr:LL-diaminopimelate aminotransferase [Rickettsiaceae bacterium]
MKEKFYLTETLPPYIFAAIYKLKQEAIANGVDIIDFGMGNPDSAPPEHVREKLSELSRNPKLYGYSVVGGVDDLRRALASYYQKRFGVRLDHKSECLVTIGAKEGIASLATAISSPDDYVVVANPGYPIHTFAFVIAKGNLQSIDAIEPDDFLRKFKELVKNATKKPVAVIVNYPSNPTSQVVDLAFYQELVDFCRREKIYIISDIAYCEIYFDDATKPHSILEIEGAKEIAIEFSSVSKSYSMAGCRVGFACGNPTLIAALHKVKSYLDYGSFEPLQLAAIDALSEKSDKYLKELRQKYFKRAKFLVELLDKELSWKVEMPKASMFLWAKIPQELFTKTGTKTSFDFCKALIEKIGVALSAGSSFGENGEGYARFSLIREEDEMIEAVRRIKNLNYKK